MDEIEILEQTHAKTPIHGTLVQKCITDVLHGIPVARLCIKNGKTQKEMTTYFLVHSRAVASYRGRSVLYKCAMSGTRGSSALGSVNIEQIESSTRTDDKTRPSHMRWDSVPFDMVNAGDH